MIPPLYVCLLLVIATAIIIERRTRKQLTGHGKSLHEADLEIQTVDLQTELLHQRLLKHDNANLAHVLLGTLSVVQLSAAKCTCGAMEPTTALVDQVMARAKASESQEPGNGETFSEIA